MTSAPIAKTVLKGAVQTKAANPFMKAIGGAKTRIASLWRSMTPQKKTVLRAVGEVAEGGARIEGNRRT